MFAYLATGCIRRSGVDQAPNQVHESLQSFAVPLSIRLINYPEAALRFHSNQAKYQMCNCFHLYTGQWTEPAPHFRLWQCDQDPVAPQRAWKWRREARRLAHTCIFFSINCPRLRFQNIPGCLTFPRLPSLPLPCWITTPHLSQNPPKECLDSKGISQEC